MTTVYCVQTYAGGGGQLVPARLSQFATAADAMAKARDLRRRAPGVVVFSVRGEPGLECWEEPEVLALYGEVPGEVG